MSDEICQHCIWMESQGITHTKNCKCGHHHNRHNFAGGCTEPDCKCDSYDQRERVVHVKEPKTVVTFEETPIVDPEFIEKLEQQQTTHSELIAAQARVDALKKLSASRPTAGPTPD